jgi:transcriptional regulator with XRE-family HTH domain
MTKSLHTPEYEYFRSLLISARENSGLTQMDVSTRLGKPQSFVAKYERGERRLDVVEFIQVCNALGIDPHVILANIQQMILANNRTESKA